MSTTYTCKYGLISNNLRGIYLMNINNEIKNTQKNIDDLKLEILSKQLEGQIYIPEHFDQTVFYQLYTAPYIGAELKYYDVKDPLMALRMIDILIDQYKIIFEDKAFPIIGMQYKRGHNGEWEIWEDSEGRGIKEYDYDENWRLMEPIEDGEFEEGLNS